MNRQYSINQLRNKILSGHVLDKLKQIPDNSIDMVAYSPPYYGLRVYGTQFQIWGGDPKCSHQWENAGLCPTKIGTHGSTDNVKNPKVFDSQIMPKDSSFCVRCNAWLGELGNEPTMQLFIDHLITVNKELMRVLKPHGTLWCNIGDTFFGGGQAQGHTKDTTNFGVSTLKRGMVQKPVARGTDYKAKCLCLIPSRLRIAMVDAGWIIRNTVIWHKPNGLPSPVNDRFTVKTESVDLFTKSEQHFFDNDATRVPLEPEALRITHEIFNFFVKKGKYFFDLDAIRIKSKTFETDPRCQVEEDIQYEGKSESTSRFHKSSEFKNPTNVTVVEEELIGMDVDDIVRKYGYDPSAICEACGRTMRRHVSRPKRELQLKESIDTSMRIFTPCNQKGKNPSNVIKYIDITEETKHRQGMNKERGTKIIVTRPKLPPQKEFVNTLKSIISKDDMVKATVLSETRVAHWYRLDKSGFSYPSIEDWNVVIEAIGNTIPEYFNELMIYTEEKLDTISDNPIGSNSSNVADPYSVRKRVKEFIIFRKLPKHDEIRDYLEMWRRNAGLTIKQIEQLFGNSTPHHWFETNGSFPTKKDWLKVKELLGFDEEYDTVMTKQYKKPSYKEDNPLGSNPSNVVYGSKFYEKDDTKGHYTSVTDRRNAERIQSKVDAKKLYPNDIKKQKEYIQHIHDHSSHSEGKNPSNVVSDYKQYTIEPNSTIRHPSKKGRFGNVIDIKKIEGRCKTSKIRISDSNLTWKEKKNGIEELEVIEKEMKKGEVLDFDLYLKGKEYKTFGKNLISKVEKKGFHFVRNLNKMNPSNVALANLEQCKTHPYVEALFNTLNICFSELDKIVKKGVDAGTFWSVSTKPMPLAHFATMPTALLTNPIKAGCPEFVCARCGLPKQWDCGCGVGFNKGIVLDPFGGSGTTGLEAKRLGRDFLLIELNPEYIEIIKKRFATDKETRSATLGGLLQ